MPRRADMSKPAAGCTPRQNSYRLWQNGRQYGHECTRDCNQGLYINVLSCRAYGADRGTPV